jgi:two-component system OmpR family sensor kinase
VVAEPIEPATVLGNSDYLKELLLVLVDNAIQYTPDGGEIRLSVAREDDEAVIRVVDNGVGIAEEDLPHLFERFYRADHSRHRDAGTARGTGLGLSIAQWISDEHHGRIEVQSQPGKGTTFTLRLPALAVEARSEPVAVAAGR